MTDLPRFSLASAATLGEADLTSLMNAAYADYYVPLHLDEVAFRGMAGLFDIDLAASRIALGPGGPVGLVLLGARGRDGWIAGMGVVPAARRGGIGRALMDGVFAEARRLRIARLALEVLEQNAPAIALYRELGFVAWRTLDVWALKPAPVADGADARAIPAAEARAWIAARRGAPEPWQRADASLDRFDTPEHPLRGLETFAGGARTGAAVGLVNAGRASLLQMHAEGPAAARTLCAAAAGWAPVLRFLNVPSDHPGAAALAAMGGSLEARQHEMRLDLGALSA